MKKEFLNYLFQYIWKDFKNLFCFTLVLQRQGKAQQKLLQDGPHNSPYKYKKIYIL